MKTTKEWNVGRLREGDLANFETIKKAAENEDLALVSAVRKSDGAQVALVTAMGFTDGEYIMYPLAVMIEGNPYELFEAPVTRGEWLAKED